MKEKIKNASSFLCDIIDINCLFIKIGIWMFTALISIAPIIFIGFMELSKSDNIIFSFKTIYSYVISSDDIIYTLVTLSTMVLADVWSDIIMNKKKHGFFVLCYCLLHILAIVFCTLVYAFFKTENICYNNMVSINRIGICFVTLLSLLSYINIAINKKEIKEETND